MLTKNSKDTSQVEVNEHSKTNLTRVSELDMDMCRSLAIGRSQRHGHFHANIHNIKKLYIDCICN